MKTTLAAFALLVMAVPCHAEPQQKTQQANVTTANALADTGAHRQSSVTHTLPSVADALSSLRKHACW